MPHINLFIVLIAVIDQNDKQFIIIAICLASVLLSDSISILPIFQECVANNLVHAICSVKHTYKSTAPMISMFEIYAFAA